MDKLLMLFNIIRLTGYATEPLLDSERIHAVVGEPTRVVATRPVDDHVRVVSWNIAQGARYDRVRNALVSLDADILLLQEVDMGVRRSDYREVARELAHDLGMNWVFAGEFQEVGQARHSVPALTGQAVLSRYPIERASTLAFHNQAHLRWRLDPLQPRRGGRMALRVESAGMVLYNAHIESAKNDAFRSRQIEEVLLDHQRSVAQRPTVFAGDFNTGLAPAESPVVKRFVDRGFIDALGPEGTGRRTSIHHKNPLDWIFTRFLQPRAGRVVDVEKASDHYPLEAAFVLAPDASVRTE